MFNTPWPQVPGLVLPALWETLEMVAITAVVVYLLGGVVGLVLYNTSPLGIAPAPAVYRPVSAVVNFVRAVPFLILMVLMIPVTRFIVGTGYGVTAAVVPMIVAGIPFVARLVENALRLLPPETTVSARAAGGSAVQIVRTVQISEALPSLIGVATMTVIGAIEFSAIGGAIGAGGLGHLAITYGYSRFDFNTLISCVLLLILLIQLVQFVGDRIVVGLTR